MTFELSVFSVPLLFSATVLITVIAMIFRRQIGPSGRYYMLLLVAIVIWQFGYAMELSVRDETWVLIWAKFQYLGIATFAMFWLLFTISFAGHAHLLKWGVLILAFTVPVFTAILALTNDAHNLIWADYEIVIEPGFSSLRPSYGMWFMVHTVVSYLASVAGVVVLLRAVPRVSSAYRGQVIFLLLSWAIPAVANILFLFGLNPFLGIDLTPFGFGLAAILLAYGIYGYRLFEIVPAAYDKVIGGISDSVIVTDAQNQVVVCNPAAEALFNVRLVDIVGQPVSTAFGEWGPLIEEIVKVENAVSEIALDTGVGRQFLELRVTALKGKESGLSGSVVMLRDVTERRATEVQLRKLSTAVEQSGSLIMISDLDGKIEYVNPMVLEVTGYTYAEMIGQSPRMLQSGDTPPEEYRLLWDTIVSGKEWRGEFHNKKKSGESYWASAIISPIKNVDGVVTNYIAIEEDITERKQNEQLIQLYATNLEERNRELDAFSHTVAHDLKKPLQGITGYSSLIQADYPDLPDEVMEFVQEIQGSADIMTEMINSLLLMARLRDAKEVIVPVNMNQVVAAAVRRFSLDIEAAKVQLEVAAPLPQVMGYGPWLEEVMANLIGNAIKYKGQDNPAPRIEICGIRQGDVVRYEVKDNGLGISAEAQKTLFQMFSRFHQKEASGFGLGLSIVLRIINKLNGQIGVESLPGEGSTFWFTLDAVPDRVE